MVWTVGDEKHSGIVQVEDLFMFEDTAYARVTWGQTTSIDLETGFQAYHFEEPPADVLQSLEQMLTGEGSNRWSNAKNTAERVILAERMVEYVHFGLFFATGRPVKMLLNKYFIAH